MGTIPEWGWNSCLITEQSPMPDDETTNLGPLAVLAGAWQGDKGGDTAPSPERAIEQTPFRERMIFEPIGLVENHEQALYGLRYATTVWRLETGEQFHEEVGYWLWDAAGEQVMRCFIVPRGVTVLAGGKAAADATRFEMTAELGSETYGICSNRFLDEEFKTVRYELKMTIHGPDEIGYTEDTVLQIKGQSEPFHHTDENRLKRIDP
jgi:hypothetical protein